jgi:multidrug efflux system membrane fusion protein
MKDDDREFRTNNNNIRTIHDTRGPAHYSATDQAPMKFPHRLIHFSLQQAGIRSRRVREYGVAPSCISVGLTILLLAATLSLPACHKQSGTAAIASSSLPTPVRVETVHLEPAEIITHYAAVVRPRIEADLAFRVGGKVVERDVDVGARVDGGTVLARLDTIDLDMLVRATEAQLMSAQADAANAHSEFARYSALHKAGWATQQEYDKRKAVIEVSDARVRELEARLEVQQNNVKYATLIADAPGVVTAVLVEPGQVVAQGQTVFRVARLGEVEAVANVPEPELTFLSESSLSIVLWSMPGLEIPGRLRELSPSADAVTRTYQARITLIDPPPGVQLGMTATLTVSRPHQGYIVQLPMTALTKQQADPAVWVINDAGNEIELRPISVEKYSRHSVIVRAGLKEGERVVTAGVHKLCATQKVRVWTEPIR